MILNHLKTSSLRHQKLALMDLSPVFSLFITFYHILASKHLKIRKYSFVPKNKDNPSRIWMDHTWFELVATTQKNNFCVKETFDVFADHCVFALDTWMHWWYCTPYWHTVDYTCFQTFYTLSYPCKKALHKKTMHWQN